VAALRRANRLEDAASDRATTVAERGQVRHEKLVRLAGIEPATLGLEGRGGDKPPLQ
jgi:hypothetical protein